MSRETGYPVSPSQNRTCNGVKLALRKKYKYASLTPSVGVVKAITIEDLQDAYNEIVLEKPRALSVISPGAKGGVKATVESAKAFRNGKELITRN